MSSHPPKKKTSSAGLLSFPSGHDEVENIDPNSRDGKRHKEISRTGQLGVCKGGSSNPSRLPRPKNRYPLRTIPSVSTLSHRWAENFEPMSSRATEIVRDLTKNVTFRKGFTSRCATSQLVEKTKKNLRCAPQFAEGTAQPSNAQKVFTPSQDPELSLTSLKEWEGSTYAPCPLLIPQPEITYRHSKKVEFSQAHTRSREHNNNTLSAPLSPRVPIFRTPPSLPRHALFLVPPAVMPMLSIYRGFPEVSCSTTMKHPGNSISKPAEAGKDPGIVTFDSNAARMDPVLLYSLEYVEDIMEHLQQREEVWLASAAPPVCPISEINRSILVNWLVKLNSHLRGDEGLLEAGVRLTDRALAVSPVPVHSMQLLALACYWIARKQQTAHSGTASRLVRYCNGAYTKQQLKAEEFRVMSVLNWPPIPPTSDCWVHYLVIHPGARDATLVARAAHYLLCGALLHAGLTSLPPSHLATVGVTAALYLMEGRGIPRLARCTAEHDDSRVEEDNNMKRLVSELLHVARKLRSPTFLCREPFLVYSHQSRDAVAQRVSAALDKL